MQNGGLRRPNSSGRRNERPERGRRRSHSQPSTLKSSQESEGSRPGTVKKPDQDLDSGAPQKLPRATNMVRQIVRVPLKAAKGEGEMKSNITVCVRKRPLNSSEEEDIMSVDAPDTLVVCERKVKVDLTKFVKSHNFTFDYVCDENTGNEDLYQTLVQPLLNVVFSAGVATCFAYGQTGSGKTFTMLGKTEENPGLYLLAANDIFSRLESYQCIYLSFFEIYQGQLFDLLNNKKKLVTREDAAKVTNIVGLTEHKVENEKALIKIMEVGSQVRSSGATSANSESSRSHAVLQIVLKMTSTNEQVGKISFIDLAGNERGADTADSDKQTRAEGKEINKSLLALKECIRALEKGQTHIPFRASKLTEVLKESFVGNSATVMIACVGPGAQACEHSLNTLRYADRVKEFKTSNVIRPQKDEATLRYEAIQKELKQAKDNLNFLVDGGEKFCSKVEQLLLPKKPGTQLSPISASSQPKEKESDKNLPIQVKSQEQVLEKQVSDMRDLMKRLAGIEGQLTKQLNTHANCRCRLGCQCVNEARGMPGTGPTNAPGPIKGGAQGPLPPRESLHQNRLNRVNGWKEGKENVPQPVLHQPSKPSTNQEHIFSKQPNPTGPARFRERDHHSPRTNGAMQSSDPDPNQPPRTAPPINHGHQARSLLRNDLPAVRNAPPGREKGSPQVERQPQRGMSLPHNKKPRTLPTRDLEGPPVGRQAPKPVG